MNPFYFYQLYVNTVVANIEFYATVVIPVLTRL